MADDPYGDAQLVTLYDIDNPGGDDHDFYRALADEIGARTVIDLGCGTGLLTRALATPGRRVIGVDPSVTMLDYARRQSGAELLEWILGDASVIPSVIQADLVICTGNAFQHIAPEALLPTLGAVRRSLRVGGTFCFDTRNPDHGAWESWTRERTEAVRDTDFGVLREWLDIVEFDSGRRVVFDAHNVFPDGRDRVYTSTLYFRAPDELRKALEHSGFADVDIAGTWTGGPVTASLPSLIVRAVAGQGGGAPVKLRP